MTLIMTRKRKTARPADPMQIAQRRAEERAKARDPAQWSLPNDALALAANADVARSRDGAGRVARARRQDEFALMHARGKLQTDALNAVRRLQDDIALLHRSPGGVGDLTPRVDRSRTPSDFNDARLKAGARIDAVLAFAGTASAGLITALCEPEAVLGRGVDWRAVVARQTGETLPDAQGALLRVACENLAGAYARADRQRPAARRAA